MLSQRNVRVIMCIKAYYKILKVIPFSFNFASKTYNMPSTYFDIVQYEQSVIEHESNLKMTNETASDNTREWLLKNNYNVPISLCR